MDNLARIQPSTRATLADPNSIISPSTLPERTLAVPNIPGLSKQVDTLNEFISDVQSPTALPLDPRWRTAAIAVHGGRGTGKSFVLDKVANAAAGVLAVLRSSGATGVNAMKELFAQAMVRAPSILLLDDLDDVLEGQRAKELIGFLCSTLDEMAAEGARKGGGVVVVASCKDYFALPHELRRLRCFARGIALPVPDVKSKVEILESFNVPLLADVKDELILEVAKRTYAFNPEDLERLAANALDAAVKRHKRDLRTMRAEKSGEEGGEENTKFYVRKEEMESALARTTPSSLNDLNLRPPTVHWKDIGGQSKVKAELQRMIREVLVRSFPPFLFLPLHQTLYPSLLTKQGPIPPLSPTPERHPPLRASRLRKDIHGPGPRHRVRLQLLLRQGTRAPLSVRRRDGAVHPPPLPARRRLCAGNYLL